MVSTHQEGPGRHQNYLYTHTPATFVVHVYNTLSDSPGSYASFLLREQPRSRTHLCSEWSWRTAVSQPLCFRSARCPAKVWKHDHVTTKYLLTKELQGPVQVVITVPYILPRKLLHPTSYRDGSLLWRSEAG